MYNGKELEMKVRRHNFHPHATRCRVDKESKADNQLIFLMHEMQKRKRERERQGKLEFVVQ